MDTYEAEDPNDRSKKVVRTQLNLLMRESRSPTSLPLLPALHNTTQHHTSRRARRLMIITCNVQATSKPSPAPNAATTQAVSPNIWAMRVREP